MSFRVLPLPTPLVEAARRTRRAPGYGHPVVESATPAGGYGPCRHCLRRTREGEARLLLTCNPFEAPEPPMAGPVFIHAEACEAHAGPGFPEELRGLPLVLRGHLADGSGVRIRRLGASDPVEALEALLADPAVAFVALQNAEVGCYVARVERT